MAEQNFFSHTSPAGDAMVQQVHSAGFFLLCLVKSVQVYNFPQPVPSAGWGWMITARISYANISTGIGVWRGEHLFTSLGCYFMRSLGLD